MMKKLSKYFLGGIPFLLMTFLLGGAIEIHEVLFHPPVARAAASASSVSARTITSSVLGRSVYYNVYLPTSYNTNTTQQYPVLYLLHGMDGDYLDWADGGMQSVTDTAIANGTAVEMIVIMPDAYNSWYSNQSGLNYETFMMNELIPYIDANYRTYGTKATRAIAGLSMGGYGAALHLFKHYDMYSSGYGMSGAYSAGPQNIVSILQGYSASVRASLPPFTMEVGLQDTLVLGMNTSFEASLTSLGVRHTYITRSGTHNMAFWIVCLPKALTFASNNFTIPSGTTRTATRTATRTGTSVTNTPTRTRTSTGTGGITWTQCASENGTCTVPSTMVVRYGANNSWFYRVVTGSIACNNSTWGDPISGTAKACYYSPNGPTPTGGTGVTNTRTPTRTRTRTTTGTGGITWTQCASENGTCTFSGTMTVRYGAGSSWYYRVATGSIACNNATFGDPIQGTAKACYYSPNGPTPTP